MSIVVGALLNAALTEIRVARAGDVLAPEAQDLALQIFNEYLDALNADSRALYTVTLTAYTLTAGHQPHTIGPSGNFNVPTRPTEILGANLITANEARLPVRIRDATWWRKLRQPDLATSTPLNLYYASDWPLGAIWLYPTPSTAWELELQARVQLTAPMAATDTLDLPQGYQQALRLTLAELCAPAFGQEVSALTAKNARDARARIWGNNVRIPLLVTWDGGMPGGHVGIDDISSGIGSSAEGGFDGGFE